MIIISFEPTALTSGVSVNDARALDAPVDVSECESPPPREGRCVRYSSDVRSRVSVPPDPVAYADRSVIYNIYIE